MPINITTNQPGVIRSIYTDIDPTFGLHPRTNDLNITENAKCVRVSLGHLLSTIYGERLFQPKIGSSIRALLFEPIDAITTLELKDRIVETIRKYEPRVGSLSVLVVSNNDDNSYEVSVEFSVIGTTAKERLTTFLERLR